MEPLSVRELDLIRAARRAVLATIAADGAPRLVPITFVFRNGVIYTPLDEKPKRVVDPRDLARARDIAQRPRVAVLVDAWHEDWTQLGWLRASGSARVIGPDGDSAREHANAVSLLRAKYAQYADHALETRPMVRIAVERVTSWFAVP
ncbi:MAG TPA: TIGR03668 family PPOX class F420-dependent oxidoreductase [Candidatus Limnocylindrales bacterium]